MAKKRTVIPFYGKWNQQQEAQGRAAVQRGNHEAATFHFGNSDRPNPLGGKRRPANVRGH